MTPSRFFWQDNLCFDRSWPHIAGIIKGGNALFELERIGNQWLDIDFTATHESQRPWIHMRVAEDCFNARLFDLRGHYIKGHRRARHADEDHCATGTKRLK